MKATGKRLFLMAAVAAWGFALVSCTDERVVFRDRPIFQEPSAAAMDFVGYSDPSDGDKLTVCGNCHRGQQSRWEETAHAFAWEGLQTSDHAQAFCEGCHTVNSLGNTVEEDTPGTGIGGYAAVDDARYHDVQCESCHGPGLEHIRNPDAIGPRPMAPITVGSDLSFGCGECHSGAHHPFVEEWENSPHAAMQEYPAGRNAANGGCFFCHSGEGALQAWGVKADYLEKEELLASDSEFAHITCAVCHDPHANEFEGQLRFPVNTPAIEDHLCAQCHNRATVPNAGPRGLHPHAPESELVIGGSVGWLPPGVTIDEDTIRGTHGSARNERLCATCHVVPFSTEDELTGETFFSVGHGFRAIPCVENGVPTGGEDCALTVSARNFDGCVSGQCHPDATTTRGITEAALTSVLDRAQTLLGLLLRVDANLDGAGGEIDPNNPTFTVAEGAFFNLELAHHGTDLGAVTTRQDSLLAFAPSTIHNPFLVESLLIWSINAVEREYAAILGIDRPTELQPRMQRPSGL